MCKYQVHITTVNYIQLTRLTGNLPTLSIIQYLYNIRLPNSSSASSVSPNSTSDVATDSSVHGSTARHMVISLVSLKCFKVKNDKAFLFVYENV